MPSDKPASLEEIQASIAKLRVTEQQLEATAQKYESKMQSSRKWNYLAVAMAVAALRARRRLRVFGFFVASFMVTPGFKGRWVGTSLCGRADS